MLKRKLWRTMRQYKAQFISMILMVTLGIGAFVGFQMEWMTIEVNTERFFEETHFADYRIYAEDGFQKEDAKAFLKEDGIKDVARVFTSSMEVEDTDGDTLATMVSDNPDVSGFVVIEGKAYDKENANGIWLSEKYAKANALNLGDEVTLLFQNEPKSFEIVGLIQASEQMVCVRDATQIMPDYKTHGFAYLSPAALKESMGMEFYPSLYVCSDLPKEDFSKTAEDFLGYKPRILTKEDVPSYAGPSGEIDEGKLMGSLMPPIFLLIGVLAMVTTMNRLVANEKVQIGTLKALGYKDKKILRHYTSYAVAVGSIGSVLGIGLGYLVGYMIMNPKGNMGSYLDMPYWTLQIPWVCLPVIAFVIAFLSLIAYLSTRNMLKGTAADALRPYAPKDMKPLRMEKSGWFHKLSFSARWNLRDMMRHKMRTAMSIVGVIGCMVIVIGSLGMQDSVEAYVQKSYYDSMQYKTRIDFQEPITDEKRAELLEAYAGDYSATNLMDYDNKSTLFEIYHLEEDKVQFLDTKDEPICLGDDGVYICQRIATEHALSVGDEFDISPYDTDETYTLKVAGIIHSVAEGIFCMDTYAEKAGVPYTINTIYTDTLKEDIEKEDAIASLQSKEMIISSFDSFMEIMHSMIFLLVGIGIILGIVVLYNLGVMMYTERYRELATLKVVGFKDKRLANILHGQTLFTTILGILIGIPAGWGVVTFVMNQMGARYEMIATVDVSTFVISAGLTFIVSLFVSLMTAKKTKKIDMVSALKGAE